MATKWPIFNNAFGEENKAEAAAFPQFAKLPSELRVKIWTESIKSTRFLRIILKDDIIQDTPPKLYKIKNTLGNIISGYPYRLELPTKEAWSPHSIGGANSEAREIYRKIYRLKIPLHGNTSAYISIDPETTTTWIDCGNTVHSLIDIAVAFLHDLLADDPKGIGLRHLALGGSNSLSISILAQVEPRKFPKPALQSIKILFSSSLQSASFIRAPTSARRMMGDMTYLGAPILYNRSVPLLPGTQCYSLLKTDPRIMKKDLECIAMETDPRQDFFRWKQFLANFGIVKSIPLYCTYTSGYISEFNITSRESFLNVLDDDARSWEWLARFIRPDLADDIIAQEEQKRQEDPVARVAGFWRFPSHAFGELPDVNDARYKDFSYNWKPKMLKDMSAFEPELLVFELQ